MLFAARNRLDLSLENGGIFWRSLVPELPDIEAVRFDYWSLNSPRATTTALPPTSTSRSRRADPAARA